MRSLLPCPFCGKKANLFNIDDADNPNDGAWYIECSNALCKATTNLQWSEKGDDGVMWLIERWNRRVAPVSAAPAAPLSEAQVREIANDANYGADVVKNILYARERVLNASLRSAPRENGLRETLIQDLNDIREIAVKIQPSYIHECSKLYDICNRIYARAASRHQTVEGAPINRKVWWCCSADYPNHEPSCPNYAPPASQERRS